MVVRVKKVEKPWIFHCYDPAYLSGVDFVNFRQTCIRLKEIADDLEVNGRPALWRWYIMSDFLRPCVESVAPWFYIEDKNNAWIWKELYVRLTMVSSLHRSPLKFAHQVFDSPLINSATDVRFFYKHLILIDTALQVKLIGIEKDTWEWPPFASLCNKDGKVEFEEKDLSTWPLIKLPLRNWTYKSIRKGKDSDYTLFAHGKPEVLPPRWKYNSLPDQDIIGDSGTGVSVWTNHMIQYRKQYRFGEKEFSILDHVSGNVRKIKLQESLYGIKTLSFNGDKIVGLCEMNSVYMIPNTCERPVPVYIHQLNAEPVKMKLFGDFVIILFEDGKLMTAHVSTDSRREMLLTDWQVLLDENTKYFGNILLPTYKVMDFDVQGQVFAAVRGDGTIFLSYMDSLDHQSLESNLYSPLSVPRKSKYSLILRLSMDVEEGLKLAMLESYFIDPHRLSCLHVVYANKER